MIIPIRTDYRRRHVPWVNYLIIAINILLYLGGYHAGSPAQRSLIDPWMLQPQLPQLEQFFTCMFLHANFAHLLGNMVFLWVFGNAVNDKLGHAGYAAFYLAGGVLAGVGYLLLAGTAPVLGASGAIAAVAGAYLVLLPATNVTVIIWFWVIFPLQISSLYFILLQFLFDSVMTLYVATGPGSGGVAYAAHATGYGFGILVAAGLLGTRLLRRDDFDLLHLLKAQHRRSRYRRMVQQGYDPFDATASASTLQRDAPVKASPEELALRQGIREACARHDLPTAAEQYRQLESHCENPILPRQQQLDVANQLMGDDQYAPAARAYERFIQQYGDDGHLGDIYLMLGLLYSRYLRQYGPAETCLNKAIDDLDAESKIQLARSELQALRRRES